MYIRYIVAFLISFAISFIFSKPVFLLCKKMRAQQTILHYVKEHEGKQGTPTMGGIMFIVPVVVVALMFFKTDFLLSLISLAVFFAYGLLGFLDDFIKVHYKQNLGLKPYQKIIGQLGIALIIAIFVYLKIGGELIIPFTSKVINIGIWIIPFIVLVYVATVNSVNLIDGLDGLCCSSSINYLFFFSLILLLSISVHGFEFAAEIKNLVLTTYVLIGSLFAFLFFNCYPAKIFMGDTGSLALGGFIASVSILTKNELLIPLLGLVFVITSLSDIIQVLHYKRTKKRIFKMAPLHHHFQMSGVHENRVVMSYFIFSLILNLIITTFYI